jgi:hypothetical protein
MNLLSGLQTGQNIANRSVQFVNWWVRQWVETYNDNNSGYRAEGLEFKLQAVSGFRNIWMNQGGINHAWKSRRNKYATAMYLVFHAMRLVVRDPAVWLQVLCQQYHAVHKDRILWNTRYGSSVCTLPNISGCNLRWMWMIRISSVWARRLSTYMWHEHVLPTTSRRLPCIFCRKKGIPNPSVKIWKIFFTL